MQPRYFLAKLLSLKNRMGRSLITSAHLHSARSRRRRSYAGASRCRYSAGLRSRASGAAKVQRYFLARKTRRKCNPRLESLLETLPPAETGEERSRAFLRSKSATDLIQGRSYEEKGQQRRKCNYAESYFSGKKARAIFLVKRENSLALLSRSATMFRLNRHKRAWRGGRSPRPPAAPCLLDGRCV